MSEVILYFTYDGNTVKIQGKRNEYLENIFKRYSSKIRKDINDLFFLCEGKKLNGESKLENINNKDNEINILVNDINNKDHENKEEIIKKNKDIICPKCGEICLINIKDYKIKLNKCNNNHSIENILLDEFNHLQRKNKILNLKCSECNIGINEIYKKKLYKCCNCKINICPLCKSKHEKHDKNHIIIEYELRNYLCNVHGEKYISYCEECNKNLCDMCEIEHTNHNYNSLTKLIINKENNSKELKIKIVNLINEINDIINKLNKIIENMKIYYNLNNNIMNNYNKRNKNFEILMNINNIYNNNELIIKDITEIINENKIENKIKYLYNIYDKMITKDKCFRKRESINSNTVIQKSKKSNYYPKKNYYEKRDKIEDKPSKEDDLKLNCLIKARGLENVGDICYMNATLQCLYHVKQLSEALVNDNKIDEKLELTYSFKKLIEGLAFTNLKQFKIDRRLNRVTGENIKSFKPENFKEVLSKKNPHLKEFKIMILKVLSCIY